MRLDKIAGQADYDDIIAGTDPACHTTTVKLAAWEGTLERGTVVCGAPGGNMAPLGYEPEEPEPENEGVKTLSEEGEKADEAAAEPEAAGPVAYYVLAEDVVDPEEGQTAVAYKSGMLARNRLKAHGRGLTADDVEALRQGGILTADVIEPAE